MLHVLKYSFSSRNSALNPVNQIRILFSPTEKWNLLGVSLLMLCSALPEMPGIGLLMAAAALILTPERFGIYENVRRVGLRFGIENPSALAVFVLLKNCFVIDFRQLPEMEGANV